MKKLVSIIAILTLCVGITGCGSKKRSLEGLVLVRPDNFSISTVRTFEDLEAESELIVIGEFIDDSEICFSEYEYEPLAQRDLLVQIASSCPMKITRVLAGDANVGDIVKVIQLEGINGDRFRADCDLTPMLKGDEWLFCLARNTDERLPSDGYWCVSDEKGRYPTKNVSSNEVMCLSDYPELGVYERSDFQEELYNKLIEKYGDMI